MAEENQAMTKDPKKVEVGKRLAEYNHRKSEAQKSEVLTSSTCYGILTVGVIGGLGYYIYQTKKGEVSAVVPPQQPSHSRPQTNKFEME